MTIRSYVYGLLTADPVMNSLGITEDSTFLSHTIDTPQVRPLMILRWMATNPGIGPVRQRLLTVWVHDDRRRGEFDRIDETLSRVRTLLENVSGVNVGEPGSWISTVIWEGDTDDVDDPDMGTLSRSSQFRITGSAV